MKLLIDSGCELMKIDDYSCANLDDFAWHPASVAEAPLSYRRWLIFPNGHVCRPWASRLWLDSMSGNFLRMSHGSQLEDALLPLDQTLP